MTCATDNAKDEKLNIAIARSDKAKMRVHDLNTRLRNLKTRDAFGRKPNKFTTERLRQDLTAQLTEAMAELYAAKADLRTLSGTTGHDPKWGLIVDAYHVLSALEDTGVDIGDAGHALLDKIEFHVPASKLINEPKRPDADD